MIAFEGPESTEEFEAEGTLAVVTADNKLSAQYEHTIAVRSNGCEILTPWHLLMGKTAELA